MSLLQIYESEQTAEFRLFLESIKSNIESYTKAKQTAQRERMMIIGSIADYKDAVPQRSSDHRFLSKAMEAEGWSRDVIYQNTLAYKAYKKILKSHEQWHPIAKKASVSLLIEIAKTENPPTYHLLMYLRRHKGLPSVRAYRGWLGGYFDDKFLPIRQQGHKRMDAATTSAPITNVEVVADDATPYIEELPTPQQHTDPIDDLIAAVQRIDIEAVYGDREQRERLEVISRELITLGDMGAPAPYKPNYV